MQYTANQKQEVPSPRTPGVLHTRAGGAPVDGNVPGMLGWVNGQLRIFRPNTEAEYTTVAMRRGVGGFALREGWNTLFFKVLQRHDTRLDVYIVHGHDRRKIMNDLRFERSGAP